MFVTLLYLVGVHAQVNEVTPPLLDRMLNALVESLVEEALRCFMQIKRFGMGGMLRVGLFYFPIVPPLVLCRQADAKVLTDTHRPRWRLSSCIRHSHVTSHPTLQRCSPTCTPRSHKRTHVVPVTKTCRATSMG